MWVIDTDSLLKLSKAYSPVYFSHLWNEIDILIGRDLLFSTTINYQEIQDRAGEEFIGSGRRLTRESFWKPMRMCRQTLSKSSTCFRI